MRSKRDVKGIRFLYGEYGAPTAVAGLFTNALVANSGKQKPHSNLLRYLLRSNPAQAGGKAGIGKQKEIEYGRNAQERDKGETKNEKNIEKHINEQQPSKEDRQERDDRFASSPCQQVGRGCRAQRAGPAVLKRQLKRQLWPLRHRNCRPRRNTSCGHWSRGLRREGQLDHYGNDQQQRHGDTPQRL